MIIVVDVAAITATVTSPAPRRAARPGGSPRSRRRKIDSSTTTALSTSIPAASISPIRERMLRLPPLKYSSPMAVSTENGIARPTARLASSRRRKANSTIMARTAPMEPAVTSSERPL